MKHASPRILVEALLVACCVVALPGLVASALASTLMPAAVFFLFGFVHGVVLGLPAYLILRWRAIDTAISCSLAGMLVGALPVGALLYPRDRPQRGSGSSVNGIPMTIDGITTPEAWASYWQGIAFFAVLGGVAGLVFWAYARYRGGNAI